ncbi:MAG: lytic murein transglycosylase B [Legionella sp.]|nr:MAG: lytic murein transglycosylase B [Legionella sp.]PJD98797.1 MAG: lytic murein transglycosylase B [Legionella sp.]
MRCFVRRIIWLGLILSLCFFNAYSNTELTQRKEVQAFIKDMVTHHHFNARQLTSVLNEAVLQPRIIESMERPYEKKNWDVYKAIFLTPQRLQKGLEFWMANKTILEKAQKQYGVPPEIIIAILGVETLYGQQQGNYRVLDALTTLAFNYPKRAPFFTKELKEYLLLCREHHVSPTHYFGSYAGAIGKPQFMPSSYRYYAVDYHKKGFRDLVNSNEDTVMSIANYFHKNGWKANDGIAQTARLAASKAYRIRMNPRSANYDYTQLIAAGVKPITAAYHHPKRAGVIELDTAHGNEYWLAYPNFFVITRYNSSPQYALAVYLLSMQLKQQWVQMNRKQHRAYV